MNPITRIPVLSLAWPMAFALMFVGLSHLTADDADVILFADPEPVVKPAPVVVQAVIQQPVVNEAKQKQPAKVARLVAPILYPTIYPNPLAFNMTWVTVSDRT